MRTTLDAARSIKRYIALGLGEEWEVRLNVEEGAYKRPFCRVDLVGSTTFAQSGTQYADLDLTAALILYPSESSTANEALFKAMAAEEKLFQITNFGEAYLPAPANLEATKQQTGSLEGDFRYRVCAKNRYGKTLASAPLIVSGVNGRVKLKWVGYPEATSYQVFRADPSVQDGREPFLMETDDEQTIDCTIYDDGSIEPTPGTRPQRINTAKISAPMRIPLYDYYGLDANTGASDLRRQRNDYLRIVEPPSVSRMVDEHDDLMWAVAANIRMSWRRSTAVTSDLPIIRSINTSEDVA